MSRNVPLTSFEVRWFVDADNADAAVLRRWFENAELLPGRARIASPEWRGRLDGRPDVYLLLPGYDDMGIKWREGMLQIKGLVAATGTRIFASRHRGCVERWIKWSYPGLPAAYRGLFDTGGGAGVAAVAVHKTRALRRLEVGTFTGEAREVDPAAYIDRGIGVELTEIQAAGRRSYSLAFEAFPDDSAMQTAFEQTVDTCLASLTGLDLGAERSLSYPAWLQGLAAGTEP